MSVAKPADQTKRTFKIKTPDGEIRRVLLKTAALPRLMAQLAVMFPQMKSGIKLQYQDDDGDLCTIRTAAEWATFLAEAPADQPLRVSISEERGADSVVGPAPADGAKEMRVHGGFREVELDPCMDEGLREALAVMLPMLPCPRSMLPAWVMRCSTLSKHPSKPKVGVISVNRPNLARLAGERAARLLRRPAGAKDGNVAANFLSVAIAAGDGSATTLIRRAVALTAAGELGRAMDDLCSAIGCGVDPAPLHAMQSLAPLLQSPEYGARFAALCGAEEPSASPPPEADDQAVCDTEVTVTTCASDDEDEHDEVDAEPIEVAQPTVEVQPTPVKKDRVAELIAGSARWRKQLGQMHDMALLTPANFKAIFHALDRHNGDITRVVNSIF